jgi:hypothetical protein
VYLLVFHAYIKEMHGSRSRILSKRYLFRQRCAEGFNSGVKGLNPRDIKGLNSVMVSSTSFPVHYSLSPRHWTLYTRVYPKYSRLLPPSILQLWQCEAPVDGRTTMSSESVCQVARIRVNVASFHNRLVMRFMIFTA